MHVGQSEVKLIKTPEKVSVVRGLAETVSIPKELLKDLYAGLIRVEEVLATLEELMDREGLERTRKAKREYVKGEYVTVKDSSEIKKFTE